MPTATRVLDRIRDQSDFAGPLTPLFYMRLDATATVFELAPAGGSSTASMKYQFNAGALPPTGSQVRLNNATQTLATQMGVARVTSDGADMKNVLMLTTAGSRLYLQDENNADAYQVYQVTAAPVDSGTYITFTVSWLSGGTAVPAQACRLAVLAPAAPPPATPGGSSGQLQYNNAGAFGGAAAVVYATSGSLLTVTAQVATDKPVVLKGAPSQSANLQEWQDPGGVARSYIGGDGYALTVGTNLTACIAGGSISLAAGGGDGMWNTAGLRFKTTGALSWSSAASAQAALDTGLARNAAGVIKVTNGSTGYGAVMFGAPTAATIAGVVVGAASQTATLVQLQGQSSTTTREMADIDAVWVTSTDASRKAKLVFRVWDTAVREAVSIAATGTGSTTSLKGGVTHTPVALTDAATIATDASLSNLFTVTLGGNRTLGNPTNAVDGQRITWRIRQDGTGTRTLAYDTKFRFGTDLTSVTLSTAINKTDYLTAIYHGGDDKFDVIGVIKGF